MPNWTLRGRLLLAAVVLPELAACQVQPPPPCLVQPATGFANYVAQYTNMVVTSDDSGDPDCPLFTTTVPPLTWSAGSGLPNYWYPQLVSALGSQLGGRPFRVSVIGLDKFAPTTVRGLSLISIAPDILGGTNGAGTPPDGGAAPPGVAYGVGAFEAETPDAKGYCYVRDFTTFGAPVDWGAGIGQRPVTFHFKNFVVYETANAPGTQFQASAEIAIGNCTAIFEVVAYAPAATCATVDEDGSISGPSAGVQPLTGDDVDPGLCMNFNPDPNDPQWGRYVSNGYTAGSGVSRTFPITCDTESGFCALPIPLPPAVPTVPIVSGTPRP